MGPSGLKAASKASSKNAAFPFEGATTRAFDLDGPHPMRKMNMDEFWCVACTEAKDEVLIFAVSASLRNTGGQRATAS